MCSTSLTWCASSLYHKYRTPTKYLAYNVEDVVNAHATYLIILSSTVCEWEAVNAHRKCSQRYYNTAVRCLPKFASGKLWMHIENAASFIITLQFAVFLAVTLRAPWTRPVLCRWDRRHRDNVQSTLPVNMRASVCLDGDRHPVLPQ